MGEGGDVSGGLREKGMAAGESRATAGMAGTDAVKGRESGSGGVGDG